MLGLGFGVIEDAAIPVAVFELDAGLSASYGGSGQTWANIVTTPADGSAQTAYDLYRGATSGSEGSDLTFNGSAGANSANEYWSFDSGDYFTLAGSNTTFLNSLHKENAAFTWYGFLRTPTSIGNANLFGTNAQSSSNIGIHLNLTSSGTFSFQAVNGSGAVLNVSSDTGLVDPGTNYLIALSCNEALGVGLFYRRGATGKDNTDITGAYASPSASSATYGLQIAAGGNAVNPVSTGFQLWRTGMFNRALSEAQLDALFERYKSKLGL
jgi:hypothetical protein